MNCFMCQQDMDQIVKHGEYFSYSNQKDIYWCPTDGTLLKVTDVESDFPKHEIFTLRLFPLPHETKEPHSKE